MNRANERPKTHITTPKMREAVNAQTRQNIRQTSSRSTVRGQIKSKQTAARFVEPVLPTDCNSKVGGNIVEQNEGEK
jgi:hypothetical protein